MKQQENNAEAPREGQSHPILPLIILIAGILGILAAALGVYLLMEQPEELPEETASFCFQLGVWDDRIAVFAADQLKPSEVLDIPLDGLPEADRQLLLDGIPLRDEEELRRAIEDFT